MNRKQISLLLFLLVVLGVGGLLVYQKQNDVRTSGDPSIGRKPLGQLPVNDVAHIALKQGTNELNLVKKDDLWRVKERNDYPANYSEISDFLLKAQDLKVLQSEKASPPDLARLALVPGQGTNNALVVEFKDSADKPLQSLLLGKKHMQKSKRPSPFGDAGDAGGWPDGRYVKLGNEADTVSLVSEAFASIEPKPEQWLNKDFFKVEKVRSISVEFPTGTNSWMLARETENGEWKLADPKPGEQLDSTKIASVSNPLSSPSFNDVGPIEKAEQIGLIQPTSVTIGTFDNFTYQIKIGAKTNDTYALSLTVNADLPKERTAGKDEKPDEKTKLDKEFKEKQQKLEEKLSQEKACEKWVFLVSGWTIDSFLKERSQLLIEKKADKSASTNAPPASVTEPASQPADAPVPEK